MTDATDPPSSGYERSDASPRALALATLLLAFLIAAALAVSAWVTQLTDARIVSEEETSPVRGLRAPPAGPELQALPARELALVRAREERLLHATEWVDPVQRIVRIPLERALELSLAEGFPVREEAK